MTDEKTDEESSDKADKADKPAAKADDKPAAPAAKADDKADDKPDKKPAPKAAAKPKAAKPAMPRGREPDAWDKLGAWIAAHGALPALGLITLAVLLFHWHIFSGESAGDDLSFHFAESSRIADCIRNLDFDWWNPSANGGFASAYYYQVLPQLASALPAAIFGHHLFWFQLSIVLPLVLAPACAYRGMRLMGASPWQSTAAAFCVAFMNGESRWGSGSAGTFNVGLYTQTWALCFFPLGLGHGARWIMEKKSLAPAIAWGGLVFLCHPFVGISLGFTLVLGFLVRFFATWRLWLSPTAIGVLLLYLGGLPLAAVIMLSLIPNAPVPDSAPALAVIGAVLLVAGGVLVMRFRKRDNVWEHPTVQRLVGEIHRLAILGGALVVTTGAILLPLTIDSEGFGGFPHRVADEIGPGFAGLSQWYIHGKIFDFMPNNMPRVPLITFSLPIIIAFTLWKRVSLTRWLWTPGLIFALMLGLGPHIGKVGNDIFPPVRFLGAMQTVLAMGLGAGIVTFGQWLWDAPWDKWLAFGKPVPKLRAGEVSPTLYGARTTIAAIAAALVVFVAYPGGKALIQRVRTMGDNPKNFRDEMLELDDILAKLPQGRKQGGPGGENHWWNLLPYSYVRVPAVLQMGGGGLQASPNYDFLWTVRDRAKDAWIYDAPYLVFLKSAAEKMPPGETLARTQNYELRKLPVPGLVSPAQVLGVLPPWYRPGQPGHIWALLWALSPMPLADQILAYAGSGTTTGKPQGHTIRSWRQPSPGDQADIVAEVDNTGPTTYWVHESWHPRWHGYVDGNEVQVRRVTPDFMAVDTGPGKHTIEMRFERPLWAWLVWLLWPVPAIIAWLLLRRRPEASAPPA
ncbi:MAG TPA: hypothetical protein VGG74_35240 [Kofleriaceae bacterium]|jgi:hypothetical protein